MTPSVPPSWIALPTPEYARSCPLTDPADGAGAPSTPRGWGNRDRAVRGQGRDVVHLVCQGSRFSNALPLSTSSGTETWSCAMTHLPSIFRRQAVHRTQKPLRFPFLNVPLNRPKP